MTKETKENQAPYTDNPTPGHPDWNLKNLAKGKGGKKKGPKTTSFSLSQKGTIG